jgi:hypothetical protein
MRQLIRACGVLPAFALYSVATGSAFGGSL